MLHMTDFKSGQTVNITYSLYLQNAGMTIFNGSDVQFHYIFLHIMLPNPQNIIIIPLYGVILVPVILLLGIFGLIYHHHKKRVITIS